MSRGPTRRVRRLLDDAGVQDDVLAAAGHEADLLAHPYIGLEHLALARLGLQGRLVERDALRDELQAGLRARWWRPRGPGSALRRRGRAQTRDAHDAAKAGDQQ